MEDEKLTVRLYHKGEFSRAKYVGGVFESFKLDPDLFSYSELMEFVKDLNYDEIGGVYVSKGKNGGWKLVADDQDLVEYIENKSELDLYIDCIIDKGIPPMKQMQPHVIVRPRPTLLKTKEKNVEKFVEKRTFVTLNNIKTVAGEIGLSGYKKKIVIPGGSNNSVKTAAQNCNESEGCNDYETYRKKRVAENNAILAQLGLANKAANLCQNNNGKLKVINDNEGESESFYCPNKDAEQQSVEDEIVTSKKIKKNKTQKLDIGAGPRTRSQANKIVASCQKETAAGSLPSEANDTPVVSLKEKLNNLKDGPGSMTAYLELREREKLQLELESRQTQTEMDHVQIQSDTPAEVQKKRRGKTKMNHVHNRLDKKVIDLNVRGQAISKDDKLVSEFSSFLGTTVRQFVSLTCASWHQVPEKDLLWAYVKEKYIIPEEGKTWVLKSMNEQFRAYKSRIKRDHYNAYATDEERLQNRPREIPIKDFQILLKYWGDEKIQEIARKNSEARSKIIETHTTGPRSFAQISNMMQLEKMLVDGEEEPTPTPISDAAVYIKTRKRDAKREYKLPQEVLQVVTEKVSDVEKTLQTEGVEAANKLVHSGKKHNSSWLVGRLIQKKESKSKSAASNTSGVSDDFVQDLTSKIRAQLQQEMDDKFDQKFQEMMQIMAIKNPELKLNIEESGHTTENSSKDDNVNT